VLLAVGFVLLFVLPEPWNVFGAAACLLAGLVEVYAWNRTVRRRRKVVGAQTLVGRRGEVRTACRPLDQVFVAGELWRARCDEGADEGASVKVAAVRGLTLEVRAEP
jgi:membrane protein implicated in regulation of membrane protease activity